MRTELTCAIGLIVVTGGCLLADEPNERPSGLHESLSTPFRVMAGDEPINVDIGHAAPWLGDFDGDGVRDLLVGQFGQGKLRIYRNKGSNAEPSFDEYEWFMAGRVEGKVPYG